MRRNGCNCLPREFWSALECCCVWCHLGHPVRRLGGIPPRQLVRNGERLPTPPRPFKYLFADRRNLHTTDRVGTRTEPTKSVAVGHLVRCHHRNPYATVLVDCAPLGFCPYLRSPGVGCSVVLAGILCTGRRLGDVVYHPRGSLLYSGCYRLRHEISKLLSQDIRVSRDLSSVYGYRLDMPFRRHPGSGVGNFLHEPPKPAARSSMQYGHATMSVVNSASPQHHTAYKRMEQLWCRAPRQSSWLRCKRYLCHPCSCWRGLRRRRRLRSPGCRRFVSTRVLKIHGQMSFASRR